MPQERYDSLDTLPDGIDARDRRALTEAMFVRETAPDLYTVRTDGGEYVVDTREPACTCPDFQYRERRCKHVRRVELETGVRDASTLAADIDDALDRLDDRLATLAAQRATYVGLRTAAERFAAR